MERKYWLNGVQEATPSATIAGTISIHETATDKKSHFDIFVNNRNERIRLEILKTMVGVYFDNATFDNFSSSSRLMGNFNIGERLG